MTVATATPALAQRTPYDAEWLVLGSRAPARTVTLQEKRSEPFAEIVPRTAFRLAAPALDGKGEVLVPAGTILTGVRGRSGVVCEVVRRPKQIRPTCLHDRDGDRRFDGWNTLLMFNNGGSGEVFFSAQPWRAETKPLRTAVALTPLDVRTQVPRFRIELWFENRAELVGKNIILVCMNQDDLGTWRGKSTNLRMCRNGPGRLGNGDYPMTMPLYGGSVVFASREGNRVQVAITPPRTEQTF